MHRVANRTAADRRGSGTLLNQHKDLRNAPWRRHPFADRDVPASAAPWRPRTSHATLNRDHGLNPSRSTPFAI
jgi:hypothetical protein